MSSISNQRASGLPDGSAPDRAAADDAGRFPVVRSCLVYVANFSAAGLNQPYLPVWLSSRGLGDSEIALVISAPMFLRLVLTPLFGSIADRTGNYRTFVNVMAPIALVFALCMSFAQGFWQIFGLAALTMVVWHSIGPVVDASVMRLIRRGIAGNYGRVRLWGSASFAAATVIGGFILGWGGPNAVFAAFVCALALLTVTSFFMPGINPVSPHARRKGFNVLKRPLLLVVFLSAALVFASQATFNTFGTVHMRELGYPDGAIGMLWALATSSEVAMFWAGPIIAGVLGPIGLLVLASVAAIIRWSLMSLDPGIGFTAVLQLLHAATFSGTYLGLMGFVQAAVEDEVGARAQTTFATMLGLVTATATMANGPLYRELGAGAYAAAAVLPVISLVLLLVFRNRLLAAISQGTPGAADSPARKP